MVTTDKLHSLSLLQNQVDDGRHRQTEVCRTFPKTLSLTQSYADEKPFASLACIVVADGRSITFCPLHSGLSHNPPGFYVDESGIAYNAYLVAHTGAGEFGRGFHSSFGSLPMVSGRKSAPLRYLLSVVFLLFPPSILLTRIFSAFWVFASCLLLGLLAKRISGQLKIGVIVAASLLTPGF